MKNYLRKAGWGALGAAAALSIGYGIYGSREIKPVGFHDINRDGTPDAIVAAESAPVRAGKKSLGYDLFAHDGRVIKTNDGKYFASGLPFHMAAHIPPEGDDTIKRTYEFTESNGSVNLDMMDYPANGMAPKKIHVDDVFRMRKGEW